MSFFAAIASEKREQQFRDSIKGFDKMNLKGGDSGQQVPERSELAFLDYVQSLQTFNVFPLMLWYKKYGFLAVTELDFSRFNTFKHFYVIFSVLKQKSVWAVR